MMSKREQDSMVFYNFCLSKSVKWIPMSNPPLLRRLVNLIILSSLIVKFFLYLKMWMKISSQAKKYLPDEYHGRCKELSGLLLGKLVYSVSEFIPMASVLTIYFISSHIHKLNEKAMNYFIVFTMPSIYLFVLPTIQLFTTPTIRDDIKEGFLNTCSKCAKLGKCCLISTFGWGWNRSCWITGRQMFIDPWKAERLLQDLSKWYFFRPF